MRRFTCCSSRCFMLTSTRMRSFGIVAIVTWATLLAVNAWWATTTTNLEEERGGFPTNKLIDWHDESRQTTVSAKNSGRPPPISVVSLDPKAPRKGAEQDINNKTITTDDGQQQINQKRHVNNNSSSAGQQHFLWLDAMAKTQLSSSSAAAVHDDVSTLGGGIAIVYPEQWKNDPLIAGWASKKHRTHVKVLQVTWTPGTERIHGIGNKVVPPEEGGKTVQGQLWPEQLSGLTYIAMVKCGHTKLMNAVGDLRQRLSGAVSVLAKTAPHVTSILTKAVDGQKNKTPGHIVFTLVRDPIDRFISGTCQEMSGRGLHTALMRTCFSNRTTRTGEENKQHDHLSGSEMMDCALQRIRKTGKWEYHQEVQVYQLIKTASLVQGLAVAAIPFDKAIKPLLLELGGTVEKIRDRQNEQVYKWHPGMASFCSLKPQDLSPHQRKQLCELLQPDVYMMTHYLNMSVPWCADEQEDLRI